MFARKIYNNTPIAIDDFVVFENDKYGLMIKQVKKISQNKFYVQGTDPYSIDSRDFGYLDLSSLRYKIVFQF